MVGSENWLHSPEVWFSQTSIHLQKSLKKRKKKSLTLCQAVERRLVWRLYEFSSHSSEHSYFTAPNVTTYTFFSTASFIFIHVEMKCSRKTGELSGSPSGFPSCMDPTFWVGCPLALLSEGWRSWSSASFPLPRSWIQLWVQHGLRSKGPGSLPRVERKKCLKNPNAAETDTKFIVRDTAGLMGEHTQRSSLVKNKAEIHTWRRPPTASWMRSAVPLRF